MHQMSITIQGDPGIGKSLLMIQAARDLNLPLICVPLAGRQEERIESLTLLRQRIAACWDFCPGSVKEVLVTRQLPRNQARRHVARVISRLPYRQVVRLNPKVAYRVVWQLM